MVQQDCTHLPCKGGARHYSEEGWDFWVAGRQNGMAVAKRSMSSFAALRIKKQNQWTIQLQAQLEAVVQRHQINEQRLDQIWLFGSRARGDWDGYSDTDLVVVAEHQAQAERWVDRLIDAGVAADLVAMDRKAWQRLPNHDSAIWRAVARDAIPLLGKCPTSRSASK